MQTTNVYYPSLQQESNHFCPGVPPPASLLLPPALGGPPENRPNMLPQKRLVGTTQNIFSYTFLVKCRPSRRTGRPNPRNK